MPRRCPCAPPLLLVAIILLPFAVTNLPAQEKSADWPQFRGPGGLGVSAVKGPPLKWSQTENLAWKTELPGPGASSPIVVGQRVFLTCFTGYGVPGQPRGDLAQLKRHVLCVNLSDGKILWSKAVEAKLPESATVRDHGYAASTPAADGERLYVFFGKSGVFAFDHSGNQLWHADVGARHHEWGSAASPVLYKDLIIVNACVESESLVALDKKTGKEVWRAKDIKESWSTPLLANDPEGKAELVIPVQGKLLGFEPATGNPLWSCATDIGWYMVPGLVARDGIVYCLGGRSGIAALAVRTGGRGDVTKTHRLWTGKNGSNVSSPVFHDGHLYWMHESLGIAYCAEGKTGKIVYEERIQGAGQVYASALLADGKIYYTNRAGRSFVLAAGTKFEQLAQNNLSDRGTFDACPVPVAGQLLLRSDRHLYCVGAK